MTEHTPGPWEVKQFGGPQISGPEGYAVCTMWGALSVDELAGQDAANALLIAASPMLLEGAQDTVEALKLIRIALANGIIDEPKTIEVIDAHIDELQFAIAAATGIPS